MKKYNKVLLLFLVIVLIMVPVTAFAAPKNVVYTALGDSIAFGTGGTVVETEDGPDPIGYVDLLEKYLIKGNDKGICYDLSQSGLTSEQLLAGLGMPYSPAAEAVSEADIITISIGGNDILGPFKAIDLSIINNPNHPYYTTYMAAIGQQIKGLEEKVVSFAGNWAGIIQTIRSNNKHEAKIYVNTVYNPLKEGDPFYAEASLAIAALNAVITNPVLVKGYDYQVVDVYTEFANYKNPDKVLVHELNPLNIENEVAIHPTDAGYKIIYNMHKHLINTTK